MTQRYLSSSNAFIPSATGLLIGYIKDASEFALNDYVQSLQTPTTVGLYARLNKDQPARVVNDSDFVWADGADSPSGSWNLMTWEWIEFACKRRAIPFELGEMAVDQAKTSGLMDALAIHAKMAAQQEMTLRTNRLMDLLQATANWGTNTGSAASLNGGAGTWDTASDDPASPQYMAISKTLSAACIQIHQQTNGVVGPKDLVLVIDPQLAQRMSNTPEMKNVLKYGPYAKAAREGKESGFWGLLPEQYGGIKIVVEDCVYVNTRPYATQASATRQYAKASNSALLLSRKGGVEANYGSPSWSTVQCYFHKWEAAVFSEYDSWNMKHKGKVVSMYAEVLAAPESGYLITDVLP